MRAEQKSKERRQKSLIVGVTGTNWLGLIAAVAISLLGEPRRPAEASIQGAEESEVSPRAKGGGATGTVVSR